MSIAAFHTAEKKEKRKKATRTKSICKHVQYVQRAMKKEATNNPLLSPLFNTFLRVASTNVLPST